MQYCGANNRQGAVKITFNTVGATSCQQGWVETTVLNMCRLNWDNPVCHGAVLALLSSDLQSVACL